MSRAVGGGAAREQGSATPLALGIVACVVLIAVALLPLYRGLVLNRALANAADSSALAGADSASGLEPGFPCERAAEAAVLGGAHLDECSVSGQVVTVVVSSELLGQRLRVEARAGPPGCVWCG